MPMFEHVVLNFAHRHLIVEMSQPLLSYQRSYMCLTSLYKPILFVVNSLQMSGTILFLPNFSRVVLWALLIIICFLHKGVPSCKEIYIFFIIILTDLPTTVPVSCKAWINLWIAPVVPLPVNTTTSSGPALTHFLMMSLEDNFYS